MKDKAQTIEKAWKINPDSVLEPWFVNDEFVLGTRGQAKQKFIINFDELLNIDREKLTILNISILREPSQDIVLYKGQKTKRFMIKEIDRLEKLKQVPLDKFYYAQDKRGYVGNCVLWWGLNSCGYVTDIRNAHKYTGQEIRDFEPRDTDIIWDADHIESILRQTVDCQYLKQNNSI
jgi:hypothetical protein